MKPGGVKIRCTKCSNIFEVSGPESTPGIDQAPPQQQVDTGDVGGGAGGGDMGLDMGDDSDFDLDDGMASDDGGMDGAAGFDEGLDDGMGDDFGDGASDAFDDDFGGDMMDDTGTDMDFGMDAAAGESGEQTGGLDDDLTIDDDFGLDDDGGGGGDSLLDDDFGLDDGGGGEGDSLLDDDFGLDDGGGGGDSLLDDDLGLDDGGGGGDNLLDDDFGLGDGGGSEGGTGDDIDIGLDDGTGDDLTDLLSDSEGGASDDGLDLGFGEDELISSGEDDFGVGDSLSFESKSIDTDFSFDGGGTSLHGDQLIMPKKKGSRRSPLFVGLGIFLVLIAGVYFVSNIFLEDGVSELLTLVENFGRREVDPLEKLNVIQNKITHYYINNSEKGKALVVEGVVINNSEVPKGQIQVRLTLYDSTGANIGTYTAYCGNILSVTELETLPGNQIRARLDQPTGDEMINARLDPGKPIKFMLVIFDIPENTAGYDVIVINAQNVG